MTTTGYVTFRLTGQPVMNHSDAGILLAYDLKERAWSDEALNRIGLPRAGGWRELINTDAYEYGGGGVGNLGHVEAVGEPGHGLPASACLRVPPLGAVWLVAE